MSRTFKVGIEIGGAISASLQASIRQAQAQIAGLAKTAQRTTTDALAAGTRGFKNVLRSDAYQAAAVGAAGIAAGMGLALTRAVAFDKAMADVRKAVDFKDGEAGLKRFGNQLLKLSTELGYTAEELTKIASAAGFAGYKEEEILPFVRAAARMGVAFQMTAEQAGDAMVAMRAAMGLTQKGVEELGDTINYLSDKFQGTVNAADLTEVTRRIGAIGLAAGLAKDEVAGLGAAFLASGTPTEIAATGLKNFLNALTNGSLAAKEKREALATILGTNADVKAQMESLQGVTGKGIGKIKSQLKAARARIGLDTADMIAKGMQTDPQKTIRTVLQALAKMPKEMQPGLVFKLFGEESKGAIMPLLGNPKLLDQAFGLIQNKTAIAGSMQREFANQMGTTSKQLGQFKAGIEAIGISIGAALLPTLNAAIKAVMPLIVRFAEWAQKNEGLMRIIVGVTAALAGLVIALPIIAGVVSAIGTIGSAFMAVGAAISGAGILATIAGWAPAIIAIATGPIGIVVAALVGVGLILKALYDKVPAFRKVWDATCAGIVTTLRGMFDFFRGGMDILVGVFTADSARIADGWARMCDGLRGWWKGAVDAVRGGFELIKAGGGSMITWLQGRLVAFVDWVKGWFVRAMSGAGTQAGSGLGNSLMSALQRTLGQMGMGSIGAGIGAIAGAVQGGGMDAAVKAARAAGFPESMVPTMAAIAMAESGGNPRAHNPNAATGDNSYGLWQVNMLGKMGADRRRQFGIGSNEALFDPATNAAAARQIYQQQGLGAWSVYRSGAFRQYLPAATESAGRSRVWGGTVIRGMDYLVGERRPEVFRAPASGRIEPRVPAATASQVANARGRRGVTLNMGGVTVNAGSGRPDDILRAVQDAFDQIRLDLESGHRLLLND